ARARRWPLVPVRLVDGHDRRGARPDLSTAARHARSCPVWRPRSAQVHVLSRCAGMVRFALEAGLEFAVAVRELGPNLLTAWRGVTQPNGLAETDHPPNRKAMTDDPGLVKLAHDANSNDSCPFFARDPSSPAPQLTLLHSAMMAHAGKAKRVNIQSGCHP